MNPFDVDLVVKYLCKRVFYSSSFPWLYYDFVTIGGLEELSVKEADNSEETEKMRKEINFEEGSSTEETAVIPEGKK